MSRLTQDFFDMIDMKLFNPEEIYFMNVYERLFDYQKYKQIVRRICYKEGWWNGDDIDMKKLRDELGVTQLTLQQHYQSFMKRIREVLLRSDEIMHKKIVSLI